MKKILNIVSSPRGAASNSIQLADALIARLQQQYPDSTVTKVDLVKSPYPHLEEAHLAGFFTPAEQHTDKEREAVRRSDEAVQAVKDADILVIGSPMYNFTINSALKAWIDHIVRAGLTFSYSEKGAEGLLKDKKVYLVMASGGIFSDGPYKFADHVEPYLRFIMSFIGLTDITTVRVEGLALPGIRETALEKAVETLVV